MSMTNLFVELIVIGIGAAGWVGLLVLGFTRITPGSLTQLASTPVAAVPALAAVYLLGIVVDRIADGVLHDRSVKPRLEEEYGSMERAMDTRAFVLNGSPFFASQFEYSRSRQRICRGWILNALALAWVLPIYVLLTPYPIALIRDTWYVASILLVVLAFGCVVAWNALVDTEVKRLKSQEAALLRSAGRLPPPAPAGT